MDELLPPKGHEDVAGVLFDIANETVDYKESLDKPNKWTRYYEVWDNRHWDYDRDEDDLPTTNLVQTHIRKRVNHITNNSPTFDTILSGDGQGITKDDLKIIAKTATNWWKETEQQSVFEESVQTGDIYGSVSEWLSFDKLYNLPSGEVVVETVDPFYYSLYPIKERRIERALAVIRFWPIPVIEARRRWPKFKDELISDSTFINKINDEREPEEVRGSGGLQQVTYNDSTRYLTGSTKNSKDENILLLLAWVKDYSRREPILPPEPEIIIDDFGREIIMEVEIDPEKEYDSPEWVQAMIDDDGTVPVYTGNIRRVITTANQNIVLEDEDNPAINPTLPLEQQQWSYCYDRFPVTHTQANTDAYSPFGISEVAPIMQLVLELSKNTVQICQYTDDVSHLQFVNSLDTGVPNEDIDNVAHILNPTNAVVSQGLRWIEPPPIPPDLLATRKMLIDSIMLLTNSFDTNKQLQQGQNVIAEDTLAMIIEQSNMMEAGSIRNYYKMIRERGRIYHSLASNFYPDSKFLTFADENDTLTPEALRIPGKLTVVSGSTLPTSKTNERKEAVVLHERGVYDDEQLIKVLGIDDADELLQRKKMGVLSMGLERLKQIGMPQPVSNLFGQIMSASQKDFEKGVKEGKIPPFQEIVKVLATGKPTPPPPDPAMIKAQADVMKAKADVGKTQSEIQYKGAQAQKELADAELSKEKIVTERVEQQQKVFGMKLDAAKIKLERQQVEKELQAKDAKMKLEKASFVVNARNKAQDKPIEEAAKIADLGKKMVDIKSSVSKSQGPYIEKGLESNNQD